MAKNENLGEIAIDAIGDPDPVQNENYEDQLKLDVNDNTNNNAGEYYQDQENQPEEMDDQEAEQQFVDV